MERRNTYACEIRSAVTIVRKTQFSQLAWLVLLSAVAKTTFIFYRFYTITSDRRSVMNLQARFRFDKQLKQSRNFIELIIVLFFN